MLYWQLGFFVYRYVDSAVGALDSTSTEYVTVEIPEGSGNKYIGQILEKSGVIKSATVFNYYTKFKNYSNFQSGYYNLQASMDLEEICKLLKQGGTAEPEEPSLGKILVPEGYTIKQISEAVTKIQRMMIHQHLSQQMTFCRLFKMDLSFQKWLKNIRNY